MRPLSLGQAGRISGISPSDIATLLIHLKRREANCHRNARRHAGVTNRAVKWRHVGPTAHCGRCLRIRFVRWKIRRIAIEIGRRSQFTESSQNAVKLSLPRTCPVSDNPTSPHRFFFCRSGRNSPPSRSSIERNSFFFPILPGIKSPESVKTLSGRWPTELGGSGESLTGRSHSD